MHGDHADLGPEREQQQREQQATRPRRQARVSPDLKREAVGMGVEQREGRQQGGAAELRQPGGQIALEQLTGTAGVAAGDQIDADGEGLPGEEEQKCVVAADRDGDSKYEHAAQRREPFSGRALERCQPGRRGGDAAEREEHARERVGAERRSAEAQPAAETEHRIRAAERRGEPDDHEQHPAGCACGGGTAPGHRTYERRQE